MTYTIKPFDWQNCYTHTLPYPCRKKIVAQTPFGYYTVEDREDAECWWSFVRSGGTGIERVCDSIEDGMALCWADWQGKLLGAVLEGTLSHE